MNRSLWLLGAVLLAAPPAARAGNNGFFVAYTSDVERGEVELMVMNDFTSPSRLNRDAGQRPYFSQMLEVEWGVTRQLAVELMGEWFAEFGTRERSFTGFRFEARYRLFADRVPLNPMIYFEYEDLDPRTRFKMEVSGWAKGEEATQRERILETRVVLSDSIGPVQWAANAIGEIDLRSGVTGWGYAIGLVWMSHQHRGGLSCPLRQESHAGHASHGSSAGGGGCSCGSEMAGCKCSHCSGGGEGCSCSSPGAFGLGVEMYGGLGDTQRFALAPREQEHYLAPFAVYHVTSRWMVHAQLAKGLTRASDDLLRFNIGYEF